MIEFTPIAPALFTDVEAATYLRLLENGEDAASARQKMNRLVDKDMVRPCLVGGRRRYSRRELDRFIDHQTDVYGEAP